MSDSIGVAVIGAGMAGKAHMAAWRNAPSLFASTLPPVRLVSIGDVYEPLAAEAAQRFGYARHDTDWRAIAEADDIDVVSVVVANTLHREIVEGLLAAGKHVLCEKPLSDSLEDARAMATAAAEASQRGLVARVGFTYRRAPGLAAIKQLVEDGTLGRVLHVSGRYWTDYGSSPDVPFSWRFAGAPGTGALADVGSHLAYVAEFLAGEVQSVNGGLFTTAITKRPIAAGFALRGQAVPLTGEFADVENDDYATFNARFGDGSVVGSLEVSRVATGAPERSGRRGLLRERCCPLGPGARLGDRPRAAVRRLAPGRVPPGRPRPGPPLRRRRHGDGRARCRLGTEPDVRVPGPRVPRRGRRRRRPAAGERHVRRRCAQHGDPRRGGPVRRGRRGRPRRAARPHHRRSTRMKLGLYNAIFHDRPLADALAAIAGNGLTGIELNTGGFLPPVHVPDIDAILESDEARDAFLARFEGTGVSIAGLNCNGNPLHPDRAIGDAHAEDVRRSIRLAARLGQDRVVTMSGLPAGEPGGTRPNWIVNAWNSAALDVIEYQWSIAVPFWQEIDALAREHGVKVALELHPQNVVFNPATIRELVQRGGLTNIGVELDASHLFWQQMDPVAVVRDLGDLVVHAAAKDVRINPHAAINGVLDNSFRRLSPDEPRTNLGGDEWANEWPKPSAWDFVALGKGHDEAYWSAFLEALREVDPDMWVNIEHEDTELGREEGVAVAAEVLRAADAALATRA